jgi:hypothetical protein
MAELYGTVIEGIGEGDERSLDRLYGRLDPGFDALPQATSKTDATLERILRDLPDAIVGPMASPTNFVMIFAAAAHSAFGIPPGVIADDMPPRDEAALSDPRAAVVNLLRLAEVIEMDEPPEAQPARRFWLASHSSTQRAASRRTRFPLYFEALKPQPLRV